MFSRFRTRQTNQPRRARLALEALEERAVPAVINVNSLADILNPTAGTVTLRSAIQQANTDGDAVNIINLTVPGTYKITLQGLLGETDNHAGEFSILPTAGNVTIQNTSGGTVVVDGNHLNRVLDINPNFDPNNPTAKFLVTLSGFTIQNGVAADTNNPDGPTSSGGGIRDIGNASLTLNNMVITSNSATADGGGIVFENTVSVPWTLTVNNSFITNNHAGDAGGGIDADGSGKIFINAGTVIEDNSSVNQGAGIWLDAIQVDTVFQTANLTVTDAVVDGNTAQAGLGGGIGNAGNGTVTIDNSTIENNFTGVTGGGFGDENAQGTLIVQNSVFVNNSAVGDGGGIAAGGPTTTITNSQIDGNFAGGSGGGLFANGTTLTLRNSTVVNNSTPVNGGGIELETSGSGAQGSTITDSTITGNSAVNNAAFSNGGGIDAAVQGTGSLLLLNDTINGNFATFGGGLYWPGSAGVTVSLQNTIVAGNDGSNGPDVFNFAGTFTDLGGNLIGNTTDGTGFNAATTQAGTAANPINPLLGPLQDNGGPTIGGVINPTFLKTEALLSGSPAINKGIALGAPNTDERGYSRPGTPSIGALEFLTANERVVQALYLDDLGRPGSIAELDGWAGMLAGPSGQQAVASAIFHSQEGTDHLVRGWYVTFLGRPAMGGEEQGFVNLLRGGQTEEQVLSILLGSQEFFTRTQTLVSTGTAQQRFVTALFQVLLNRTPTAAELTAQVGNLATLGQQGLALSILMGQEYRTTVITSYYANLLHRPGDAAGINGWVFSNLDLATIQLGFESSSEFFTNG
jgi:hypothetical protein